jgi:hypothetical protein
MDTAEERNVDEVQIEELAVSPVELDASFQEFSDTSSKLKATQRVRHDIVQGLFCKSEQALSFLSKR